MSFKAVGVEATMAVGMEATMAVAGEAAAGVVRQSEVLTKAEKRLASPTGCKEYLRRKLAKEFPGIVDGFVQAAKTGSVPHLKLVTELLRPVRKGSARLKGPAARFFEKLEKEKMERERGNAGSKE